MNEAKDDNRKPNGFLIIDKPPGPTSHDIIDRLRRITGVKKIGHAGTLDPFASGVLIVAVGRAATRNIGRYVKLDKEYEAVLRLGAVSDTYDRTGDLRFAISDFRFDDSKIANRKSKIDDRKITIDDIHSTLACFTGKQKQAPPMYSAKKVGGKKLYELARKGIEIERQPAEITIYELKLLTYEWPSLKIKVRSSSGTYIRSLAHDIGRALGCGAYLEELTRTAVGEHRIEEAVSLDRLKEDGWGKFLSTVDIARYNPRCRAPIPGHPPVAGRPAAPARR